MRMATWLAGMALALSAAPALASPNPPPIRVDLTITYNPPPEPEFAGSELTGLAGFLRPVVVDLGPAFAPDGPPIDIGRLTDGQSFHFRFLPGEPCVGGGTCELHFAFLGGAGGFPAFAFGDGSVIPSEGPDPPPIIPLGLLSGQPNPPPIHDSGPIYAFDAPVLVGTWDVTLSAAPEPAAWALLLTGFAGLGASLRRRPIAANR